MLLPAILGGIAGAVASTAVPWLVGAARQGVPRWFGWLRIAYVRTVAATVGGLAAAAGISLSISDHTHKDVTYLVWYGIAGLGFALAIALTIVIDRRLMKEPEGETPRRTPRAPNFIWKGRPTASEQTKPLTPAERQRIARETEGRLASEIHDPTLRVLDKKNKERRAEVEAMERSLPLPALADELSRCKERGVAIRHDIAPPTGYATTTINIVARTLPAINERNVRVWSSGIRAHLEKHAPRYLVIFDDGPDLPAPHLFASVIPTANRSELLAFLDHKLAALDRIVRTIIEGGAAG